MIVELGIALGVGDSIEKVGVREDGNVPVAVRGTGEGIRLLVAVGISVGTHSTREIDNAPTIKPIEINAITSALLKSRPPRINQPLWLFVLHRQSGAIR